MDEMIDRAVAAIVPELKIALKAVLGGEVCHAFTAVERHQQEDRR